MQSLWKPPKGGAQRVKASNGRCETVWIYLLMNGVQAPCHDRGWKPRLIEYLRSLLLQRISKVRGFPLRALGLHLRKELRMLRIPILDGRRTLPRFGYLRSPLLWITTANPLAPTKSQQNSLIPKAYFPLFRKFNVPCHDPVSYTHLTLPTILLV